MVAISVKFLSHCSTPMFHFDHQDAASNNLKRTPTSPPSMPQPWLKLLWLNMNMWLKQCHKPPMTGNGLYFYTTYKNGYLFLGDGAFMALFYPHSLPIQGHPRWGTNGSGDSAPMCHERRKMDRIYIQIWRKTIHGEMHLHIHVYIYIHIYIYIYI